MTDERTNDSGPAEARAAATAAHDTARWVTQAALTAKAEAWATGSHEAAADTHRLAEMAHRAAARAHRAADSQMADRAEHEVPGDGRTDTEAQAGMASCWARDASAAASDADMGAHGQTPDADRMAEALTAGDGRSPADEHTTVAEWHRTLAEPE